MSSLMQSGYITRWLLTIDWYPPILLQYFESLLQEVKDESEREISSAVEKAVTLKLQKVQAKLDRCVKEKKFLDDVCFNFI